MDDLFTKENIDNLKKAKDKKGLKELFNLVKTLKTENRVKTLEKNKDNIIHLLSTFNEINKIDKNPKRQFSAFLGSARRFPESSSKKATLNRMYNWARDEGLSGKTLKDIVNQNPNASDDKLISLIKIAIREEMYKKNNGEGVEKLISDLEIKLEEAERKAERREKTYKYKKDKEFFSYKKETETKFDKELYEYKKKIDYEYETKFTQYKEDQRKRYVEEQEKEERKSRKKAIASAIFSVGGGLLAKTIRELGSLAWTSSVLDNRKEVAGNLISSITSPYTNYDAVRQEQNNLQNQRIKYSATGYLNPYYAALGLTPYASVETINKTLDKQTYLKNNPAAKPFWQQNLGIFETTKAKTSPDGSGLSNIERMIGGFAALYPFLMAIGGGALFFGGGSLLKKIFGGTKNKGKGKVFSGITQGSATTQGASKAKGLGKLGKTLGIAGLAIEAGHNYKDYKEGKKGGWEALLETIGSGAGGLVGGSAGALAGGVGAVGGTILGSSLGGKLLGSVGKKLDGDNTIDRKEETGEGGEIVVNIEINDNAFENKVVKLFDNEFDKRRISNSINGA